MIREGYTDEALSPSLPSILGWDLSGIVETVGPDVRIRARRRDLRSRGDA